MKIYSETTAYVFLNRVKTNENIVGYTKDSNLPIYEFRIVTPFGIFYIHMFGTVYKMAYRFHEIQTSYVRVEEEEVIKTVMVYKDLISSEIDSGNIKIGRYRKK